MFAAVHPLLTDGIVLKFRTRVFGTPTAGYTSGNQLFPMPDGSQLALTASSTLSRTV